MSAAQPKGDNIGVAHPADERALLIAPAGPRRDGFAEALRAKGLETEAVGSVEIALEIVRGWSPNLVLLDTILLVDGSVELCRSICELVDGPTLLLGSGIGPQSFEAGLKNGSRDDLALSSKVHSLAKETGLVPVTSFGQPATSETLEAGPIRIELATRSVVVRGEPGHFGRLEYDLLLMLLSPAGKLRSPDELLGSVWGRHRPEDVKTLHVHIRRLRQKIELNMRRPKLIINVRGLGFYFNSQATSAD